MNKMAQLLDRHLIAVLNMNQERTIPDSKVHGAYMGPIWGRQDPGGPHEGPMHFAIRDIMSFKVLLNIVDGVQTDRQMGGRTGRQTELTTTEHYLNQCWLIFNCTHGSKPQWNSNRNTKLFINENAFENVFYEILAQMILSRVRWVSSTDWIHSGQHFT